MNLFGLLRPQIGIKLIFISQKKVLDEYKILFLVIKKMFYRSNRLNRLE